MVYVYVCIYVAWHLYFVIAARKAELSTELLDKGSTSGGVAAAAASDYEYRGQGIAECFQYISFVWS